VNGIDEKPKKSSETGKRDFKPGDVVVVKNMDFHDRPGCKSRPTVVLSSLYHNQVRQDVVVVSIYSHPVAGPWDLNIEHWREAGLNMQSKVVCDNISTVLQDRLTPIGHIDPETLTELRTKVALILETCKGCEYIR
jgi:mRNA-degrading endonuclease toxin of MazEF toxin-antitoxin module